MTNVKEIELCFREGKFDEFVEKTIESLDSFQSEYDLFSSKLLSIDVIPIGELMALSANVNSVYNDAKFLVNLLDIYIENKSAGFATNYYATANRPVIAVAEWKINSSEFITQLKELRVWMFNQSNKLYNLSNLFYNYTTKNCKIEPVEKN